MPTTAFLDGEPLRKPMPAPRAFACGEHGQLELDDRTAALFCKAAERAAKRLKVPKVLERIREGVKAAQVVGVISVPGATLEILPKIDGPEGRVRGSLLHMLCVAWNLRPADGELAGLGTQRSDLLELLISLFANRVLVAVRRGLPRRYVGHEEDLKLMRGRLHVVRQITTLAARPDVLACRFDELSENTPLNRVLKAAVSRLTGLTRSADTGRRLAELAARLEFVGDTADPLREQVRLDRTNTAFHDIYRQACRFLAREWQDTTTGAVQGFALLFPMNELFEEFVGRSVRAASARPVHLQHWKHHAVDAARPLFALRPDIAVETPDGWVILDTKWKRLTFGDDKLGIASADIYQMAVYGDAYRARRVVLIYPWHEGVGCPPGILRNWSIRGTGRRLDVATVDVGRPDNVVESLRQIVQA